MNIHLSPSHIRPHEAATRKRADNAPVGAIWLPFKEAVLALAKSKASLQRGGASVPVSPVAANQVTAVRNDAAAGGLPVDKKSPGDSHSLKECPVRDSPLTTEEALRIAVRLGLLVCAVLFVVLFLAYDVHQSLGKLPSLSNMTASGRSMEATTELPTPFFMR